jgi:hypothetical protein
VGAKAWNVFRVIQSSPELFNRLYNSPTTSNKKQVFARVVKTLLERDSALPGILVTALHCSNGHDFCSGIASRMFNCLSR